MNFWEDSTQQSIWMHCCKTRDGLAVHLPALLAQLQEIRDLPEPRRNT